MPTSTVLSSRPAVDELRLVDSNGASAIERAGFCADGDYCERWRCRACGQYWLGDELEPHVCGTAAPDLEQRICTWMAIELEEGADLATCEQHVLARVKTSGLGEALLDAYGPHLIDEVWRDRDHDDDIPRTRERRLARVAAPGVRRVDIAQLSTEQALLECIFVIAGRWVRLGDLTRHQCQVLQRQYVAAAGAFGKLAASLTGGQIVREHWTAKQLEALAGDTLRGAALARPM